MQRQQEGVEAAVNKGAAVSTVARFDRNNTASCSDFFCTGWYRAAGADKRLLLQKALEGEPAEEVIDEYQDRSCRGFE